MPKEMPTPSEVMRLTQSATDAVNDMGGSSGAMNGLDEATGARATFQRAQGKVKDWSNTAHGFAQQRPLTCIFLGFVLGLAFGLLRRYGRGDSDE